MLRRSAAGAGGKFRDQTVVVSGRVELIDVACLCGLRKSPLKRHSVENLSLFYFGHILMLVKDL